MDGIGTATQNHQMLSYTIIKWIKSDCLLDVVLWDDIYSQTAEQQYFTLSPGCAPEFGVVLVVQELLNSCESQVCGIPQKRPVVYWILVFI